MLSDNGEQFTDRFGKGGEVLFDRICRDNGITHRLTQPRHPTTGTIERFHGSLRGELLTRQRSASSERRIEHMSAFPWTTLITAGAPVVASLGAILIKGRFDDRAQARQAEQASVAAASDRQRQAYAGLVQSAHFWRSSAMEIREEFRGLPKDEAIDRSRILVQDVTLAVALVELIGSAEARSAAGQIYKEAMAVGEMFAQRLRQLAAAREGAPTPAPGFDSDAVKKKIDTLNAAIKEFVDRVRAEPGGAPRTSSASG